MTAPSTARSPSEPTPPEAAGIFGAQLPRAVRYAELLTTWGVERGLLGPREPERIWQRHLLNSAALAGAVPPAADVVDVGSGAGLPGVALALARPDLRVCLLEPMQRRADFLAEVVAALDLDLRIVCGRAEDAPRSSADVVVARAVAPLERLIPWTLPLLRPGGSLLALKGRSAAAEVAKARPVLRKYAAARVSVGTVSYGGVSAGIVRIDLGRRSTTTKAVRQ